MTPSQSTADVAVVGLGRVGLPLALSFADRGLSVSASTMTPRASARSGKGACRSRRRAPRRFSTASTRRQPDAHQRVADAARARHIVITLGTPSFSHIEIDMRDIRSALDDLLGVLEPGHSLVLRSTITPGTTQFVAGYLAKHRGFQIGEEVFVSHAPERIAAGTSSRRSTRSRASSAASGPARVMSPPSCSASSMRR